MYLVFIKFENSCLVFGVYCSEKLANSPCFILTGWTLTMHRRAQIHFAELPQGSWD